MMRKVVGLMVALVLTLAAATSWAAEIEGKLQSMDVGKGVIVLDNGTQLWLAEGVKHEAIAPGTKVKASYEERDGKKVITKLSYEGNE